MDTCQFRAILKKNKKFCSILIYRVILKRKYKNYEVWNYFNDPMVKKVGDMLMEKLCVDVIVDELVNVINS